MRRWSTTKRAGIAALTTAAVMAATVYAVGFRPGGVRGDGKYPQCRSMFLA